MTTFSVVQGSGAYVSSTSNNRSLTGITAGNILVAFVSARDGSASSTMSITDDNSGAWNYVDGAGDDNELGNTNARYAMRKAWRVIGAGEDGDNLVVTGHTSGNNNGTFVAELEPSAAFVPSVLGSSVTGSGTGSLDGVSTNTGSLSGSDLLHVIIQGVRQGSAIGGFQTTQYTPTTEYLDFEVIAGSNQISGCIGVAIDGQTASGVVTATSDLLAPNEAAAEGIIAQIVFENIAGGDNIPMAPALVTVTGHDAGLAGAPGNQSDDFSAPTLDTGLWTTINQPGNTTVTVGDDGTDYWLEMVIPDGTNRDAYDYTGLPLVPYAFQPWDDGDMDIRLRFLTQPSQNAQGIGIIVYQDDTNYIRFDWVYGATGLFGWCSRVSDGVTAQRINETFSGTWYPYFRVTRSGDTFSLYRSSDGASWTQVGSSFDFALTVNNVGPYILSTNDSTGFTGRFDWFEDYLNDPISDEDAGGGTNIAMAAGAVTVAGHNTTEISAVNIAMAAGAVTVAGHDTTETENVLVAMAAGAVTVSGHDATEIAGVIIPMAAGAVTVSGHDTTEIEAVNVAMAAGAVTVSGHDTTETESVLLAMDAGLVAVTGHDFTIIASIPIAMDAGAVTVSGHDTTETEAVNVAMAAGVATVAGHDTTETENVSVAMAAAQIVVTGYDFSLTDETSITMDAGSVTISGHNTTETENIVLAMAAAQIVVTGHDAAETASVSIAMDAGAVTVAGYDFTITAGVFIAMDAGAVTVSGHNATVASVAAVPMDPVRVTVTGHDTLDGLDLSPAPRLPRDDSGVMAGEAHGLGFMVSYAPVTGPFNLSLLQTRTPEHWVSPLDRQVYNRRMAQNFETFEAAEAEAEPVLEEFAKDRPKPPQNRGVTS